MILRLARRLKPVLALSLAAIWASTCRAQFAAPVYGPAAGVDSVYSPPPDFGAPPMMPQRPSDGSLPGTGPTPSDQILVNTPSDQATPTPNAGGGGSTAGPSGDGGVGDFGGRGGMEGFGGGLHPVDSLRYGVTWFPTAPVSEQSANFEMLAEDFSYTHPLWTDALNALSLAGGVRNRLIDSDAILPNTGQEIPGELWNVNLGLRYARQLNDGWVAGGGLSIGSASDQPFATIREMNVGANAMLRVPQGEHNAWIFSLNYSPTGELNFPLPGIAFSYNPSPQFHANIGVPFQMTWRPTDEWQFQASYMLLRTVHIKAQYRFMERCAPLRPMIGPTRRTAFWTAPI